MKMKLTLAAALSLAAASAHAQSETIFGIGGSPAIYQPGGIYVTVGPQFQSFGMPTYRLGFTATTGATFVDNGGVASHDVRVNAIGANLGLGYVFAPAMFGLVNPRVELIGTFVASGSATDNEFSRSQGGTQLVNGAVVDFGCDPCDFNSRLRRDGTHFRFALMFGGDMPIAPNLTLTPSIGAFGGRTQVSDSLFQTFADPGLAPGASAFYTADSNLKWWDIGGRVKAVLTYQATPWLAVFVGGHADFASRQADFRASDFYGSLSLSSSISGSASRFNVAAGGQLGVVLNEGNWLIVSLIGGVDYDTRVPYIRRPSTSNFVATNGTVQTPASLAFSGAVNIAAQLKVTVKLY